MRMGYTLYPEAIANLNSSGITKRVKYAIDKFEIKISGYMSRSDILEAVKGMDKDKLFDSIPDWQRHLFKQGANDLFKNRVGHFWKIRKLDGSEISEVVEEEDILSILGYWSKEVLKLEEMWDFERFGFKSLTDLSGSVAALIGNELHKEFRDGYRWQTTTPDGRTLDNCITGDMHSDLRIFQTDRTPYETVDPMGFRVSYRPELDFDKAHVLAYHSTELPLLAAVVKWVNQNKIPSKALANKGKETIDWVNSLGQGIGNTAQHLFGDPDKLSTRMAFSLGNLPLIEIDEKNLGECTSDDILGTDGQHYIYGVYTNSAKEIIFIRQPIKSGKGLEGNVASRFLPSEADHLVKGIFYQAAKGLGRTSARQLVAALEYRFSPQYEDDIKR